MGIWHFMHASFGDWIKMNMADIYQRFFNRSVRFGYDKQRKNELLSKFPRNACFVSPPALFNDTCTIYLCLKCTSAKIGQISCSPLPMMLSAPWHPILQFHDHPTTYIFHVCPYWHDMTWPNALSHHLWTPMSLEFKGACNRCTSLFLEA